ncbi:MAG: hypothetical protein M1820_009401 [Bogoriella megaspora]|nr:MAG: hypothetical protein M1820_009401 [Bogoriella megaspora]
MPPIYVVSVCPVIAGPLTEYNATREMIVDGGTYADLCDDVVADLFPGRTRHDFFLHEAKNPCLKTCLEFRFNRERPGAPTRYFICEKSTLKKPTVTTVIDLTLEDDEPLIEPKVEPLPVASKTCTADSNGNALEQGASHRDPTIVRAPERSNSVLPPADETHTQPKEPRVDVESARATSQLTEPRSSSQTPYSESEDEIEQHSRSAADSRTRESTTSQERRLEGSIEKINESTTSPRWNLTIEEFHRMFPAYRNSKANQAKRWCGVALRTFHDTTPGVTMSYTFQCIHAAYRERIKKEMRSSHPPNRSWLPRDFKKGCARAKSGTRQRGRSLIDTNAMEEDTVEAHESQLDKRKKLLCVEIERRKALNPSTASGGFSSPEGARSTVPSSFGKIPSAQPSHFVPRKLEKQYTEAPKYTKLALTRLFESRWGMQGLGLEELYKRFEERIFESRDLVNNITAFCNEATSLSFEEAFEYMQQAKDEHFLSERNCRQYWEPRDIRDGMTLALSEEECVSNNANVDSMSRALGSSGSFDGTIYHRPSLMRSVVRSPEL